MKDKLGAICLLWILFVVTDCQAYPYDYMEDECYNANRTLDLSTRNQTYGIVRVSRYGGYHANLHCDLTVLAPTDHQLVFRFRRIEIYRPSTDCSVDYVRVTNHNRTVTMCGYGTPINAYESHGRIMRITFHSASWSGNNYRIGFELVYTAYHKGNCEAGKEYTCSKESRCIPKELTCDNYDNCGDWSDERGCPLSTSTIIGIVFAGLFVLGMAGCCVMYACQTNKANKNRRRTAQNNRNVRVTTDGQGVTVSTVGGGEYQDLYGPYNEPPPPYTHLPVASVVGVNNASFDPSSEYTPPDFASIAPPSYAREVMAGRMNSNGPNAVQNPTYAGSLPPNEAPPGYQNTNQNNADNAANQNATSSGSSNQNVVDSNVANQAQAADISAGYETMSTSGAANRTVTEQGSIINVQPATSAGDVHVAVKSAKDAPLPPAPTANEPPKTDTASSGQGAH